MQMKCQSNYLFVLVTSGFLIISFSAAAEANTLTSGRSGSDSNSWSQLFATTGTQPVTQLDASIQTPGISFTGPFSGLPLGWSSTQIDSQDIRIEGPSSGSMEYTAGFESPQTESFTINWSIFTGTGQKYRKSSGDTTWSGSDWFHSVGCPIGPVTRTPEPSSIFLCVVGLLVILFLAYSRRTAAK